MSSTKVVNVTPTMAQKWLRECNTHNRTISQAFVKSYAQDMRNHAWGFTHQGIAFDDSNTLVDGQHRLLAVIEAGETVPMLVTTGLPKTHKNGVLLETIDLVDRGRARRVGQQLQLSHGYKHGNMTAAAAKTIAEMCCGKIITTATTPQTLAILDVYGTAIVETISEISQRDDRRSLVVGVIAFGKLSFPEVVGRFSESYFSMVNVPKGSPIHALRRWLANHTYAGSSNHWTAISVIASAIHHFRAGNKAERLYGSDDHIAELVNAQKRHVKRVADLFAAE